MEFDEASFENPYEKLRRMGVRSIGAAELLAIAVSKDPADSLRHLPKAVSLLARGLNEVGDLGPADLYEFEKMPEFDTVRLLAAIEIGRRSGMTGKGERKSITGVRDVVHQFSYLAHKKSEHFCALFLNTKNGILGQRTIHIGTVNVSLVGAREVFREAIREGASSVIVAHNHPSGDPTPSPEDFSVTDMLKEAGELLDIPLVDHIIIGHERYYSFKEKGNL